MKYMNNRFFIAVMVMLCVGFTTHAESHWSCDEHAYQYDMTAYVQLTDGGIPLQDYSDYEIAAFVGDECRGIAQIVMASKPYGLIRIRSNESHGDYVTLRVYKFSAFEEINIYDVAIEFTSQGIEGLPSAPISLELTHKKLPGDTNGDGEVNIADINKVIDVILSTSTDMNCDVNGDGEVNIADINFIIDLILNS